MPEFNLSNSYQKNTLCPGSAVIFRIAESLIKGTKTIRDVTSLWFSQVLTRNQTNAGVMRSSSLTLHTEVLISHRDYIIDKSSHSIQEQKFTARTCACKPQDKALTGTYSFFPDWRGNEHIQHPAPRARFSCFTEDQGLLMLGNIKSYYIMVPNKEFSSSSSWNQTALCLSPESLWMLNSPLHCVLADLYRMG